MPGNILSSLCISTHLIFTTIHELDIVNFSILNTNKLQRNYKGITQILYRGNMGQLSGRNFRIPLPPSHQVRKFKVARQWARKGHLTKDILVLRSRLFQVYVRAVQ